MLVKEVTPGAHIIPYKLNLYVFENNNHVYMITRLTSLTTNYAICKSGDITLIDLI
jgi:hypothetical protein